MGTILESCGTSDNCCQHHSRIQSQSLSAITGEDDSDEISSISVEKEKKIPLPQDVLNIPIRRNSLIVEWYRNPYDIYDELETLGSGGFGLVKKVCLKNNPESIRAMKIIPRDNLLKGINDANLLEEIFILKNLDHPNIMKLYEFFVDYQNFYIISEFFDQGDLLKKIQKLRRMNQIVVKFIMNQVFNAISYLHSKGVLHGDIKLENIMLYTTTKKANQRFTMISKKLDSDENLQKDLNNFYKIINYESQKNTKKFMDNITNYEIKLIDFGCSKLFSKKKHKKISGIIGTSLYCSPEVVDNLYDEKCDEWSCGVLMYILLSGKAPFSGETEDEIFEKIKKCKYNFDSPEFKNVNDNCKDLIKKLLEPSIHKRIKASEALKHPFFVEEFDTNKALIENKDLSLLENLINIKPYTSKFHQSITAFLCVNYISKDEEKKLRKIFRYIDQEGKNLLNIKTLEAKLKENGYLLTNEKIDNIMKTLDRDSNGTIEYQEFLAGVCDKESLFSDNNLKSAFNCIDQGEKGYITADDIKNFIFKEKEVNNRMFIDYLKQFGMEIEDQLNYNDFVFLIRNNKKLNSFEEEKELIKRNRSKTFIINIESCKSFYSYMDSKEISSDNNEEKDNKNLSYCQ